MIEISKGQAEVLDALVSLNEVLNLPNDQIVKKHLIGLSKRYPAYNLDRPSSMERMSEAVTRALTAHQAGETRVFGDEIQNYGPICVACDNSTCLRKVYETIDWMRKQNEQKMQDE